MAHLQIARDGLHNLWSRLAVALPAVQPSPFPAMPTALPSLRSVAKFALGGAQLALFPKDNAVLGGAPLACTNPVLSCHNTTSIANTCCFNSPGGQLLQTQFWDTSPSTGPSNSWTIHGLWPDHCDGTFSASCDASRAYTNISAIISAAGQTALLGYMNTYWKNADGTDESFWEHEWAKHGTCISTLEPSCFTNYQPQEEVVDFFNRTVELFKTLDSYSFLAAAGIVPSSSATYTSAEILAALKAPRGVSPAIQCESGALDEIWYFFNVQGSVITGTFVPSEPNGASSACPATGVRYLPKSGSPAPTTLDPSPTTTSSSPTTTNGSSPTTTNGSSPTSTPGTPFTGEGNLIVTNGGSQTGCIISGGEWYVGGTCATFTATASGDGSTLVSGKGPCAVTDGTLSCASGNTATVFGNDGSDDLTVDGSSAFYASAVPSGSTQETVTTSVDTEELTITWQAT